MRWSDISLKYRLILALVGALMIGAACFAFFWQKQIDAAEQGALARLGERDQQQIEWAKLVYQDEVNAMGHELLYAFGQNGQPAFGCLFLVEDQLSLGLTLPSGWSRPVEPFAGKRSPGGFPIELVQALRTPKDTPTPILSQFWLGQLGLQSAQMQAVLTRLPESLRLDFQAHLALWGIASPGSVYQVVGQGQQKVAFPLDAERLQKLNQRLAQLGVAVSLTDTGPIFSTRGDESIRVSFRRQKVFALALSLLILGLLVLIGAAVYQLLLLHNRRQSLLHSVSHEFRTPLAAILQCSEMLLDDRVLGSEKSKSYLGAIHQQGRRLEGLIENLLAYARIERRIFSIDPRFAEIHAFVGEWVESCQLNDSFWVDHLLLVENDQGSGSFDASALGRVLDNLLTNARKYGQSPVSLRSRIKNDVWILQLNDSGPGFAAHEMDRLLEPYVQVDRKGSGGIGLGLHLVRQMVEAHGGHVRLGNVNGAQITLEIPLRGKP